MTVIDVPASHRCPAKYLKSKKNIFLIFNFFNFFGWATLTPRTYAGSSAQGTPKLL
jgi:hypothetical protein